ncbi:VOC family protein [Sphingomonas sp. HMP6]|uniref:VOC family protein n=1 Tax=Sphingomonas sp. HMP6 TaxID=1517551 RepID=UPI001596C304|nr:VOC family protein [Sphingomonas sp. HMP6]BCA58200.1 bleomycin resistance protein [Sphingomonas sp. HMP6]
MARFNYVELPVRDVPGTRAFYALAFGWDFTDFGPDYSATTSGDTDMGINGDATQWTAQLLPVIDVDDLEAVEAKVRAAGGEITVPIFAFPGGRRFHFRDVAGHELAVMQADG